MLGRLLCCALVAAAAVSARSAMPPAPLTERVMGFKEPSKAQDVGFSSRPYVRPADAEKSDIVMFDPATMPHPDRNAVMPDGPDRAFVPRMDTEEEGEPVHTTHRNMVFKGLSGPSNQRQSIAQDVLDQLEQLDSSDMPRDPAAEPNEDCSSEDQVLSVGEAPVFSRTPAVPTKETRGASTPEVNSYSDFASGLPDDSQTEGGALPAEEPEHVDENDNLNAAPLILRPINETRVDMPFKFAGKIQFRCPTDLTNVFEESYGKLFRDALGTAAQVPAGNVDIHRVMAPTVVDFDIGAPSLAAVYSEISAVRAFAKAGGITQRMSLNGFPHSCDLVILSLGDGVEEGVMPEPSMSDQLGPPGGLDEDAITPAEMRERVRARDAMTYGEYTTAARFNVSHLSPHLFKGGNSTEPRTFYVVGRLKFLCPAVVRETFAAVFSPVIIDALQSVTDVTKSTILVTVDGKPQPRAPQVLLQADVPTEADAVIVDFEIPAFNLDRAREIQTAIVAFLSDNVHGFADYLQRRSPYNMAIEVALLHIEIHGFDGMVVDEECDEEGLESAEEAEAEDSIALSTPLHVPRPHATRRVNGTRSVPFVTKNNATSADCDDALPKPSQPATDASVRNDAPPNSHDDWAVMATKPSSASSSMNLPGRVVFDRILPLDETTTIQTDAAAHTTTIKAAKRVPAPVAHKERRVGGDREIGAQVLLQRDDSRHDQMQQSLLSVLATSVEGDRADEGGDDASMPEPEMGANVPAGGFPVPDNDTGAGVM